MVTIGIDAHKNSLAVCLVDELGRQLAGCEFANEARAHRALFAWVVKLAPGERRFGIESTGWVGRGIACFLVARGEQGVDVRGSLTDRPRRRLRGDGKSDPRDALAIARVTCREQLLPPVRADSRSRDLKLLCDYRVQLIGERTRTANRLHVDLVSLRPGYERTLPRLDSLPRLEAAERLLAKQPGVQATLARRRIDALRRLDCEIKQLEREIKQQVAALGSGLTELVGISYLSAARIIGEVGDIHRIANRARFARMNGTAPIRTSSGQTQRHRLKQGRQPPLESRTAHDGAHPSADGPPRPRLRRTPPRRRTNQTRRRLRAQAPPLRRRLPAATPRRRPERTQMHGDRVLDIGAHTQLMMAPVALRFAV